MTETVRDENYHVRRESEKYATEIEEVDRLIDLCRTELREIEYQNNQEKQHTHDLEKSTNETHVRVVQKQVRYLYVRIRRKN